MGKLVAATRCTTIASSIDACGDPLHNYFREEVVRGLAVAPDLQAMLATLPSGDRRAVKNLAAKAVARSDSGASANLGTSIHAGVEAVLGGGTVAGLPDTIKADVEGALAAIRAAFSSVNATEQFLVVQGLPELAAGSADYHTTGAATGSALIADLKTVSNKDAHKWSSLKWAVQLALYANGQPYNSEFDRDRWGRPLVDPDESVPWESVGLRPPSLGIGAVITVVRGSGVADIVPVDLEAGWRYARLACDVRAARKAGGVYAAKAG